MTAVKPVVVCWHRIPKRGHLADHPCHVGCVILDERPSTSSEANERSAGVCVCPDATWDDHRHCKHDKCCHCDCTTKPVAGMGTTQDDGIDRQRGT